MGGQKVYPSEVESALLELDNVREVTVWGEASPVTGQVVAARVTLVRAEDLSSLERRIHVFFRGRLDPYKIPAIVEIVDGAHHGERFKKVRPRANGAATARPGRREPPSRRAGDGTAGGADQRRKPRPRGRHCQALPGPGHTVTVFSRSTAPFLDGAAERDSGRAGFTGQRSTDATTRA